MEALAALDKLFEEPARARLLAEELGRRAAKLDPTRGRAPLLWTRAGRRRAPGTTAPPARPTGARCRSTPRWPSRSPRWARWPRRKATGRRSPSCSRARWRWRRRPTRKGPLLLELAVVQGDRLERTGARAWRCSTTPPRSLRDEPRVLDLGAPLPPRRRQLAGGRRGARSSWRRRAPRSRTRPNDTSPSPRRPRRPGSSIARSRSTRDRTGATTRYRPTLERLSAICFERGQWDNAWKATEALLDRHGAALEPGQRATLLVRSAIADLHVGQRVSAVAQAGRDRHPRRRRTRPRPGSAMSPRAGRGCTSSRGCW